MKMRRHGCLRVIPLVVCLPCLCLGGSNIQRVCNGKKLHNCLNQVFGWQGGHTTWEDLSPCEQREMRTRCVEASGCFTPDYHQTCLSHKRSQCSGHVCQSTTTSGKDSEMPQKWLSWSHVSISDPPSPVNGKDKQILILESQGRWQVYDDVLGRLEGPSCEGFNWAESEPWLSEEWVGLYCKKGGVDCACKFFLPNSTSSSSSSSSSNSRRLVQGIQETKTDGGLPEMHREMGVKKKVPMRNILIVIFCICAFLANGGFLIYVFWIMGTQMLRQRSKELGQGQISDGIEPVDDSTRPQTLPAGIEMVEVEDASAQPHTIDEATNTVIGPPGMSRERLSSILLKEKGALVDMDSKLRLLDFSGSSIQDMTCEDHHVHHIDIANSLEDSGAFYREDAWSKPYRYEILYILNGCSEKDGSNYLKKMGLSGPVICRRALCSKDCKVEPKSPWKYIETSMAYLVNELASTGKLKREDGMHPWDVDLCNRGDTTPSNKEEGSSHQQEREFRRGAGRRGYPEAEAAKVVG